MLNVVIAKPTKMCPARCSYCSAAAGSTDKWEFEDFKFFFDKLEEHMPDKSPITWLWHGGEPMLMGPEFYLRAYYYAKEKKPNIEMSMQSNLLIYETKKWKDVLFKVCGGRISSSYDPDAVGRIYNGSAENYTKRFFERLQMAQDDGLKASIIGTFTGEMVEKDLHMRFFDLAKSMGEQAVNLRYNYRYPAGRAKDSGNFISPETYGKMIVDVYNRWLAEAPNFTVIPQYQLLEKTLQNKQKGGRCPWTNECGGHFIGLETNGNVWNCGCFADTEDNQYLYGNLKEQSFEEIMSSEPALRMKRRKIKVPQECRECRNFDVCRSGCARDSVLFGGGLYDKTYYCEAWNMMIDRIKETIQTGEVERILQYYPNLARLYVAFKYPHTTSNDYKNRFVVDETKIRQVPELICGI